MSTSNQREHKRVAATIGVKVRSPDGRRASAEKIRNISLGGVFIEMDDPLPFGTDIDLEFTLPEDPRVVQCKGFVVWSTKTSPERAEGLKGIGVRLMDIGVRDMRLLNEFIEEQLKQV
ncbi:MAG: PilZ domain-containing protein [Deltaproteobacteria bacterium]|nr:PilZ domain-containing protein [Deltaproteobacteria bacterium]